MAESESPARERRDSEAEPTVEFGDPERFAIRIWIRESRGKRIFARAKLHFGEQVIGRSRELVKLKDFAEALDDARYRLDYCSRDTLPDSVRARLADAENAVPIEAIDEVWQISNGESDEPPLPELAERFLWIEGLEAFDGFRTIFYTDGDEVVIAWREVRKSTAHVRRLPRAEYEHVIDDFLDWFEETARYHLRPPLWYRRYTSRS